MKKTDVIYVAGAFTTNRASNVFWNVAIAEQVAYKLIKEGHCVFLPHRNFGWLAMAEPLNQPSWNEMMEHCLTVLRKCDHLVLCPLYEYSHGARIEKERAEQWEIPITHYHWNDMFKDNDEPV